MTNKRKKLIRKVADRAGVSHAGAANILNKTRLVVDRTPVPIEGVFEVDTYGFLEPDDKQVGTFQRVGMPVYEKDPADTAYIIGEDGEHLLAISKPSRVIAPMVTYEVGPGYTDREKARQGLRMMIVERMLALLEAAATKGYSEKLPELPRGKAPGLFRERFQGRSGRVRLVENDGRIFGVLDQAGVMIRESIIGGIIGGNFGSPYVSQYVGLVAFGSRVEGVQLA